MSFIDLETDARPKRRKSADIADRVAVRHALTGVIAGLGELQRENVFLRAHLARQPAMWAELEPRIVTLGQGIKAARDRLDDAVASLSEKQRRHSRVRDLQRVLDALYQSIPRLTDGSTSRSRG